LIVANIDRPGKPDADAAGDSLQHVMLKGAPPPDSGKQEQKGGKQKKPPQTGAASKTVRIEARA
jgi:hypothetical protein